MLYDDLLTLTKNSVLRIRDTYPGSELVHPGFKFFHLESQIQIFPSRIPDLNFSNPAPVSKRHRIPEPDFFSHPGSGSRGQKGTVSRIRIRDSGRNPGRRRKKELYGRRYIDLDEEMLEGDGLVCVVVHVGVPEVGENSQLSRHCLKKKTEKSINQLLLKVIRIAKKKICGGCRTVFLFKCIGLHMVQIWNLISKVYLGSMCTAVLTG